MNSLLLQRTNNHIILDQISTWPSEIIQIIEANKALIENYLQLKETISQKQEVDPLYRATVPFNEYQSDWDSVLYSIEGVLNCHKLVGFHCTRMVDEEIENVKEFGLKPLRREATISRLSRLSDLGIMTKNTFNYLRDNNLSSEQNREGLLFFFHGVQTLKDNFGLYQFFKFWGGESIYRNHINAVEIYAELSQIGKPCIVLASIEYANVCTKLANHFIMVYLKQNMPSRSYDVDDCVKVNIPVIDVITIDDPLFEVLTDYSTW